ncbi:DMT family transporter [Microlunatus elymi]|uniref:DMT family transporter n=2 Tax=Microlunatus elymi TaxID=2596828 RepID=A0A516Q5Q1_9ACTN|nr:DMT family transporter [Microlunatus elymi]
MCFVGSSTAVSQLLVDAPLFTAQAVRYGIAAALLALVMRLRGQQIVRPAGREWLWLLGLAVSGLVVFNVALVRGARHAEPAVIAVAVAAVPILLGVLGPLLERRRPGARLLLAAAVVTAGAVLVVGVGRTDLIGIGWALVALICEAGFTLLAVPVLPRLGPAGVSLHSIWIATVLLAAIGVGAEGPAAVAALTRSEWIAIGYLAVFVTVIAFLLWYGCVQAIGADRAGLLTGVAPVAAALIGAVVLGEMPALGVWLGIAVVIAGLAIGLGPSARRRTGADAVTLSRTA